MMKKNVVILGKFDGIHVAHAKLISTACDIASKFNMQTLVYSMQRADASVITNDDEKLQILTMMGVDKVVFRALDEEFMSLDAARFVSDVLIGELGAAHVVVGENFRFGKGRMAGSSELVQLCTKYSVGVTVIDTICISDFDGKDDPVSSTKIRSLISCGRVDDAAVYLGRPYTISGTVREGKHLGRTLGFPTVNLYPDANAILPANGVYATVLHTDGERYEAVTNVGVNPTVDMGNNIKAETHVFGNVGNLYGKKISVEFIKLIRPEKHFPDVNTLKTQVESDKLKAKEIHGI
ncbi:MAG: bifunctional riboflavin kinase/FAD synthetase [Clostridia bacterium]|nr:bifunctional riboflavin kinase/FAD synthetase [Clostridia bacterium]